MNLSFRSCLHVLLPLSSVVLLASCTENHPIAKEESGAVKAATAVFTSESPAGEAEKDKQNAVPTIEVSSKTLERVIKIPAELSPFRDVNIYPKVQGFVNKVMVDRGSIVRRDDLLIQIVAPELDANCREARAKLESARAAMAESKTKVETLIAQKEEAEAALQADEAGYSRILEAAKTEGAIAPADIEAAEKTVQGAKARVRAATNMIASAKSECSVQHARVAAAEESVQSLNEMKKYLSLKAPFNGVIEERNVHEGSLIGPAATSSPLLKLQDVSKLRLMVPVPEFAISGITAGSRMTFTVPSYIGTEFQGYVSRISPAVDKKTRTKIVELDVDNLDNKLSSGMYVEVAWKMKRPYETLFVPSSSIITEDGKCFVVAVKGGTARRYSVSRGQTMGNLVEVIGPIRERDQIVLDASPEIKSGEAIQTRLVENREALESAAE